MPNKHIVPAVLDPQFPARITFDNRCQLPRQAKKKLISELQVDVERGKVSDGQRRQLRCGRKVTIDVKGGNRIVIRNG